MTNRLYYADSYARAFAARIVERLAFANRPAVVLDRTYFYPTSGGQPFDRGTINGTQVEEVSLRPEDGAIVHVLAGEISGEEARGEIDWTRRFDHMQQHTGQHILSQAFMRAAGAETVSFHLGEDTVTIDLAAGAGSRPPLKPAAVEEAEDIANRAVMENLPVRAWFPAAEELAAMALRNTPEGTAPGSLRVVAIDDFDYNACGGTHVARAGEIGLIKIVKLDRRGEETRVEFRCGWRALADYRRKNETVSRLAAEFTCGHWEVAEAVARLRTDAQASRRELKAAREQLLNHEAASLAAAAPTRNGWRVVRKAWPDRDVAELRALAVRLSGQPDTIALLGAAGRKAHLVLARADGLAPDMREVLKSALEALASQRGGGSPALAQGGGVPADMEMVERALGRAESELLSAWRAQ